MAAADIKIEEKRNSPRINFHSQLRYQVRGTPNFENAITNDISASGIRFTGNGFIPTASPLMLEINVFNRVLRPIGRIAWSNSVAHSDRNQFGLEFVEFDPAERNYLKDFLNMKLGAA